MAPSSITMTSRLSKVMPSTSKLGSRAARCHFNPASESSGNGKCSRSSWALRLAGVPEAEIPDSLKAVEQRVTERVRELRTELQADETAVAQEIVRMAARSDISEELERFRGHVSHWTALADGPEPCGRKLDFLLQEMNREVNTMGSKADGLRVSELIIAAKAELEKMREQVQNVE